MTAEDHDTRRIPTDSPTNSIKRRFTITSDTMKKVKWVQNLLKEGNPHDYTIRSLAGEVKKQFGTSMNTNLLADILQACRDGNIDDLDIEISTSRRGRPTTLSPSSALKRATDRKVRRITDTIESKPEHLVIVSSSSETALYGFGNAEEAHKRIKDLLTQGVSIADIAYYKKGQVKADFNVNLVQPEQ